MVERMRRLRMSLASSSPGASGVTARPNYVGPSGNGLVEADECRAKIPAGSRAFRKGGPCPSPEGGPEDEGKTPQWSAGRRTPTGRTPQGVKMLPRASRRSAPSHFMRERSPS
jgi:hypothetical protein